MRQFAETEGDSPKSKEKSRTQPVKTLPTNRIAIAKQLDIVRAYAAKSEPDGRAVTNSEVGEIVGLNTSTVALANAFLTSIEILEKSEGGFVPSAAAKDFLHAYRWNSDTAANKLAPPVGRSWFNIALMAKLRFRANGISEDEAIQDLAEAAKASPEYRGQLRMLLELLEATGIVIRENGSVRLAPPGYESHEKPAKAEAAVVERASTMNDQAQFATSFSRGNGGGIQLAFNVNIDTKELGTWSPDRLAQLFKGMALVLAAKNAKEMGELENEMNDKETAG